MKSAICAVFVAAVLAANSALAQTPARSALSAEQIKRAIVDASIASYSGNCPCPYNLDRAGRRCGRRSASRPGGAAPFCYDADVSVAMIDAYRKRAR
ncbi:MAG TPA: hypothetical protein VFD69_09315 [Vicinamibacterales bacterium]|nr:hypothetical protein [Vicinamibacterales bacterium]